MLRIAICLAAKSGRCNPASDLETAHLILLTLGLKLRMSLLLALGISQRTTPGEITAHGQIDGTWNLAVYLARNLTGLGLREIVTEFVLTKYRTVSSIVVRTEALLRQDKQLRNEVQRLRNL